MRLILLFSWIALFVFICFSLLSALRKRVPSQRELGKGSDMVFDEICKVYLPKERAKIVEKKGKKNYFCSEECKEKFLTQIGKNGIF